MILPIYIYNHKILSTQGNDVQQEHENLSELINDMFETMYAAGGIGLAAQQIGQALKLFVVDISHYAVGDEKLKDFKKVFINSEILEEEGDEEEIQEGCLSVPGVHIEVKRKPRIKLKYLDEKFIEHEEWFDGLAARCIQHEHDHTRGELFMKKANALRRRLLQGKLQKIAKGNFSTNYKYKI